MQHCSIIVFVLPSLRLLVLLLSFSAEHEETAFFMGKVQRQSLLMKLEENDRNDERSCLPKKGSLCYGLSTLLSQIFTLTTYVKNLFNKGDNWNKMQYTCEN